LDGSAREASPLELPDDLLVERDPKPWSLADIEVAFVERLWGLGQFSSPWHLGEGELVNLEVR
jgi:hypothetical protein